MKQPHDNWGKYYDYVYERTFGGFYHKFTSDTIEVIKTIMQKGTIVDYGAGTGRLTIPLKKYGYDVIAVEKSIGMVTELEKKKKKLNLDFQVYNCSASEYENGKADLALAVFTVLSYTISENELKDTIRNIGEHLKSGGYFFFDLPGSVFFNTKQLINIQSEDFNRSVSLEKSTQKHIYNYHEKCSGYFEGNYFEYEDIFPIRYWEIPFVDKLLKQEGFMPVQNNFPQFNATGSTYKLYQKI